MSDKFAGSVALYSNVCRALTSGSVCNSLTTSARNPICTGTVGVCRQATAVGEQPLQRSSQFVVAADQMLKAQTASAPVAAAG